MSLVGFSRFPLGYGDKTKILWKPLLTQNPAMGLAEFSAQWESGEPHQAHGLHNLYWVAYTTENRQRPSVNFQNIPKIQ